MLHGHGGNIFRLSRELDTEVIDFSANANPFGPPPGFTEHLAERIPLVTHLPEPNADSLRKRLADRHGFSPENLSIGAGTTEFIHALPRVLQARTAHIPGRAAYADYSCSALAAGAQIIKEPGADIAFLSNPVNPTGRLRTRSELQELARQLNVKLFIIDESYLDLTLVGPAESVATPSLPEGFAVLRSFSKSHGVPGLRLGILIAEEQIISQVEAVKPPWTVSTLAQIGGHFFLNSSIDRWVESTARKALEESQWLQNEIARIPGLAPQPSACTFFLTRIENPDWNATSLTHQLSRKGFLVRDCTNFRGLGNNHIRISPRIHEENQKLLLALETAFTAKPASR